MNQRERIVAIIRRNRVPFIILVILLFILIVSLLYTLSHCSKASSVNAPTNLTGAVVSPVEVALTWQDSSLDETGFEIQRKEGQNGKWMQIALVGADIVTYSDTKAKPSTLQSYRVRAFKDTKFSSYSNEYSTFTPSPTPTPPQTVERYGLGIAVTGTKERVSVVSARVTDKWGDPNPYLPHPTSVTELYHAPPGTLFLVITVVINNLQIDQGLAISPRDFTLRDTATGGEYNWYEYTQYDVYPKTTVAPLTSQTGVIFYLIPASASGSAMEVTHKVDYRLIVWEFRT